MRVHCDHCGAALTPEIAVRREIDGEIFYFCDSRCLARGRHLAPEQWPDEGDVAAGPLAAGDLDDEE